MDTIGIIASIVAPAVLILILFLFPKPEHKRWLRGTDDRAPTNVERLKDWKTRRMLADLERMCKERAARHHPLTRLTPLNDIERARLKRRAGDSRHA